MSKSKGTILDKVRYSVHSYKLNRYISVDELKEKTNNCYGRSGKCFTKKGRTIIDTNPAKQKRNGRYPNNNLQMPTEKECCNGFNNVIPDKKLQRASNVGELHFSRDIILDTSVRDCIDMLSNLEYKRLIRIRHTSNENNSSLYLSHAKHNTEKKDYTGAFVIKFYDKSQEIKDKYGKGTVQLNETPTENELKAYGSAYNSVTMVLDTDKVNILRIEIVFKNKQQLKKINGFLTGNKEKQLTLNTLIDKFEKGEFQEFQNEIFDHTLKNYVLYRDPDGMDEVKGSAINRLALKLQVKNGDLHEYKGIYRDFGEDESFKDFVSEAAKVKPISPLYRELYYKILGKPEMKQIPSLSTKQGNMACTDIGTENNVSFVSETEYSKILFILAVLEVYEAFKNRCNVISHKMPLKQYILSTFPVPMSPQFYDDS